MRVRAENVLDAAAIFVDVRGGGGLVSIQQAEGDLAGSRGVADDQAHLRRRRIAVRFDEYPVGVHAPPFERSCAARGPHVTNKEPTGRLAALT